MRIPRYMIAAFLIGMAFAAGEARSEEPLEEPVQETQTEALPEDLSETELEFLARPDTSIEVAEGENEPDTDVPLPVSDVPVTGNVLPRSELPAKVSGVKTSYHPSKGCRAKPKVHARKQKQMGKGRSRKGSKRKCQAKRKTR